MGKLGRGVRSTAPRVGGAADSGLRRNVAAAAAGCWLPGVGSAVVGFPAGGSVPSAFGRSPVAVGFPAAGFRRSAWGRRLFEAAPVRPSLVRRLPVRQRLWPSPPLRARRMARPRPHRYRGMVCSEMERRCPVHAVGNQRGLRVISYAEVGLRKRRPNATTTPRRHADVDSDSCLAELGVTAAQAGSLPARDRIKCRTC